MARHLQGILEIEYHNEKELSLKVRVLLVDVKGGTWKCSLFLQHCHVDEGTLRHKEVVTVIVLWPSLPSHHLLTFH